MSQSWILVRKATGEAIAETFLRHVARAINTDAYEAIPAGIYLASLNDPTSKPYAWARRVVT